MFVDIGSVGAAMSRLAPGPVRVVGQPNLEVNVDRAQAARFQINVADVQDAVQTAIGGSAITQVLQGEQA